LERLSASKLIASAMTGPLITACIVLLLSYEASSFVSSVIRRAGAAKVAEHRSSSSITMNAIAGITLHVSSIEQSIAFYSKLGMRVIEQAPSKSVILGFGTAAALHLVADASKAKDIGDVSTCTSNVRCDTCDRQEDISCSVARSSLHQIPECVCGRSLFSLGFHVEPFSSVNAITAVCAHCHLTLSFVGIQRHWHNTDGG
jgi:hypothetical protein